MSRLKSVLFITYHFPPEVGGIQTRITNYCENLSGRGVRVIVLFLSRSVRSANTFRFAGADVYSNPGGTKYLLLNSLLILRLALSRKFDVVHVFTGASTVLGSFGIALGRIARVPSVMSIFGREDIALPSLLSRTIFVLSARIATSIAANSEATKDLLPFGFRSKSRILLGGAKTAIPKSPEDKIVLFVGRLAKRKGVDDLIDAFAMVKESVPGSKLVIVGDGPERADLTKKAKELRVSDIEFKGALFGESLNSEYARSSVCVLPSKSVSGDTATEGLGLTLIEASMHGKPLVGTRHGGIPEIIQDGITGLLVPEGDKRSLSGAISRLLNDDDLARRLGINALRFAHERYSWDAATDRLLTVYGDKSRIKQ